MNKYLRSLLLFSTLTTSCHFNTASVTIHNRYFEPLVRISVGAQSRTSLEPGETAVFRNVPAGKVEVVAVTKSGLTLSASLQLGLLNSDTSITLDERGDFLLP